MGRDAVVLPNGCPHSVGLLEGICWMKSQSPCYSAGMVWLQMTGAHVLLEKNSGGLIDETVRD